MPRRRQARTTLATLAAVEVGNVPGDVQLGHLEPDWRPPRRRPGMPDPGVVTLEQQPDEEHAFGPPAPLVAEWRELRISDDLALSWVERAGCASGNWRPRCWRSST